MNKIESMEEMEVVEDKEDMEITDDKKDTKDMVDVGKLRTGVAGMSGT